MVGSRERERERERKIEREEGGLGKYSRSDKKSQGPAECLVPRACSDLSGGDGFPLTG